MTHCGFYCTDHADVRISPSNAKLLEKVRDYKAAGFFVPPWTSEQYDLLIADINRVAEWKWEHKND